MGEKMSEWTKTILLGVVCAVLILLAKVSAPVVVNPEVFAAEGEEFYPGFVDPLIVKSLEVTTYQADKGTAKSFKVSFDNGQWVIPSHNNYPADAEDRIKKTSSALIGVKKDILYSDRTEEHAKFNVLDPLDTTLTNEVGFGKRVALYDNSGNVLAEYILGKAVPKKEKKRISTSIKEKNPETGQMVEKNQDLELTMRYVRVPGKKRTYGAWTSADVSSRFSDWINTNLLEVTKNEIESMTLNPYKIEERALSINLSTGAIMDDSKVIDWNPFRITKQDEGKWVLDKKADIEQDPVTAMLDTLENLTIVGVRRKPLSLTRSLEVDKGIRLDQQTLVNLRSMGFFVLPFDKGEMLFSNEGEVEVARKDGVVYSLRLGEILYGEGDSVTAGGEKPEKNEGEKEKEGKENRYVFLMARFDESLIPKPIASKKPPVEGPLENDPRLDFDARRALLEERARDLQKWQDESESELKEKREEWKKKVDEGKAKAKELNDRFASWYYVISGSSFKKLHLTRDQLLTK